MGTGPPQLEEAPTQPADCLQVQPPPQPKSQRHPAHEGFQLLVIGAPQEEHIPTLPPSEAGCGHLPLRRVDCTWPRAVRQPIRCLAAIAPQEKVLLESPNATHLFDRWQLTPLLFSASPQLPCRTKPRGGGHSGTPNVLRPPSTEKSSPQRDATAEPRLPSLRYRLSPAGQRVQITGPERIPTGTSPCEQARTGQRLRKQGQVKQPHLATHHSTQRQQGPKLRGPPRSPSQVRPKWIPAGATLAGSSTPRGRRRPRAHCPGWFAQTSSNRTTQR
mmetsp:Transcript_100295/g.230305  ORF Transcript_100295/g.230305 Transcript_100295/m.230305 type:complete len:274 (-) Transcript_100295:881-1702(-)